MPVGTLCTPFFVPLLGTVGSVKYSVRLELLRYGVLLVRSESCLTKLALLERNNKAIFANKLV